MNRLLLTPTLGLCLTGLLLWAPPCAAQHENEVGDGGASYASRLPASDYYLARNTLVEIELLESLDTSTTRRNHRFHYRVTQDIRGDGGVVIARGSEGSGLVRESRKGSHAVTARLLLGFGDVPSVEGRKVKLGFTLPALRANERPGGLRPIIGGYFEASGTRARLLAGQKLLVAVEYPYGMRVIQSSDNGTQYHRFQNDPVQE